VKVALATDWLNQFGGGERVLMELCAMFPHAPIYTAVHEPRRLPAAMQHLDVRTSFLQRIPFARKRHRPFLPLMPMAFEEFDLSEFDLVLTTSSACAKGVIVAPGAVHICYCFTPCRYVWDLYHEYTRDLRARAILSPVAHWFRMWDQLSSQRVDHFIAISREVAGRIRRHYRREAEVIHPPGDVERFRPDGKEPDDFLLVVSRLVGYKRIDLAIEAANRLRMRLVIVGDGPERARLESLAGPTVEFLGRREDEEIALLYARCRAFLFTGHEDFGIAPVEAQAAGRPVVAYGRGGALETVIPGVTGVYFNTQSVDAVIAAVEELEETSWDPIRCRRNAERFAREVFVRRMREAVQQRVEPSTGDADAVAEVAQAVQARHAAAHEQTQPVWM
jgi:glycosyltransferase involved in cell wall biosynthesis